MGDQITSSGKRDLRGFASMAKDKQRQIASSGGKAAHLKGTAHEWTSEEARAAGRVGGRTSRGGRGKLPPGVVADSPQDLPPRMPPPVQRKAAGP